MTLFLFIIAAASGLLGSAPLYLILLATAGAAAYAYRAARHFAGHRASAAQKKAPPQYSNSSIQLVSRGIIKYNFDGGTPPGSQILARRKTQDAAARREHTDAMYIVQCGVLLCYLAYWLLRTYSSVFYLSLTNISLAFSGAVGWIISRPISMGTTYSGLDLFVLFAIASAVNGAAVSGYSSPGNSGSPGSFSGLIINGGSGDSGANSKPVSGKPRFQFLIDFFIYLLIWAFYVGFWTVLAENSIGLGLHKVEPLTGPLDFRFLLFALLAAAFSLRHKRKIYNLYASGIMRALYRHPRRRMYALIAQAALIATCALLLAYSPPAPAKAAPPLGQTSPVRRMAHAKRIVFWDTGIDMSLPQKGVYGLERVGMFGVLPHYLEERGYICEIIYEIDASALDGASALVVINPLASPSADAVAAVSEFVRGGGGVLAIGDHTGDEQIRRPLNRLLSPVGIEFNFDSAIPFQNLWSNAYITRKSPIFGGIADRQLNIVVGASLSCGFRARPLLIGKTGYSDAGDIANEADGYLGDMRFSRGERVGDLVLMAEGQLGKGVYLAVGDTTLIQNTVLAYSAPFIDNIFAHITAGIVPEGGGGVSEGGGGMQTVAGSEPDETDSGPGASFDRYCLIESHNMPAFAYDKSGNAADGLIAASLRTGMMPYLNINESLADVLDSSGRDIAAVVINGPAKPYSRRDISALDRFIDRGGTLVLIGHYNSPEATRSLTELYAVMYDSLPIGRIAPTANPDMAFWDACPVLIAPEHDAEVLMSIWGYPIIYRVVVSEGEIIVVGDEGFIKNKNLEGIDEYRMGNIEFIEEMLERAKMLYN